MATVKAFTDDGLFIGQPDEFFELAWTGRRSRFGSSAAFDCCVFSPCCTGGRCNWLLVTAPAFLILTALSCLAH